MRESMKTTIKMALECLRNDEPMTAATLLLGIDGDVSNWNCFGFPTSEGIECGNIAHLIATHGPINRSINRINKLLQKEGRQAARGNVEFLIKYGHMFNSEFHRRRWEDTHDEEYDEKAAIREWNQEGRKDYPIDVVEAVYIVYDPDLEMFEVMDHNGEYVTEGSKTLSGIRMIAEERFKGTDEDDNTFYEYHGYPIRSKEQLEKYWDYPEKERR